MKSTAKKKPKFWGYGIVGNSGAAWWDESCVCEDREPLLETCANLNDDAWSHHCGDQPYRVVKLFRMAK